MKERLRQELIRKAFHLTGLSAPLVYFFFQKDIAILYTSIALIGFTILEFVRVRAHSIFPFSRTADLIQRPKEKTSLAANVYFCVAAVISIYFFSENAVLIGLSAALIGDATAAIVGVGLGKHQMKSGKSWEGTLAGIATVAITAYVLNADPFTIIALGLVFLIFDVIDLGLDDNFTTPLVMVIVVQMIEAIL